MSDRDIETVRGNTICCCGAHTSGVCATDAALDRLTTRLDELEDLVRDAHEIFVGEECELIEPEHLQADDFMDVWAYAARSALAQEEK